MPVVVIAPAVDGEVGPHRAGMALTGRHRRDQDRAPGRVAGALGVGGEDLQFVVGVGGEAGDGGGAGCAAVGPVGPGRVAADSVLHAVAGDLGSGVVGRVPRQREGRRCDRGDSRALGRGRRLGVVVGDGEGHRLAGSQPPRPLAAGDSDDDGVGVVAAGVGGALEITGRDGEQPAVAEFVDRRPDLEQRPVGAAGDLVAGHAVGGVVVDRGQKDSVLGVLHDTERTGCRGAGEPRSGIAARGSGCDQRRGRLPFLAVGAPAAQRAAGGHAARMRGARGYRSERS